MKQQILAELKMSVLAFHSSSIPIEITVRVKLINTCKAIRMPIMKKHYLTMVCGGCFVR